MPDSDGSEPYGRYRQMEIYTAGTLADRVPDYPISYEELEAKAKEALSPEAFAYVAGGAGAERTVETNDRVFSRWRLVPRMLRDVETRDLSTTLFDEELSVPFLLAPIGAQGILHEDGDLASARAAAALEIPFVHSTQGSASIEDIAGAIDDTGGGSGGGPPRWFQLYWSADRDLTASLVERAEAAGYGVIVLTLDTPLLGWRERDLERGYLPFLDGAGLANYFSDPVFRAALDRPPEEDPGAAISHFTDVFADPSLTWDDLDWLRERTDLPIVLKGILSPDDAFLAAEHADGLVVSNHGGRQIDGAIGAVEALPGVVGAVEKSEFDCTILFDSGIRRGADAIKALALGADSVLLGRPYAYGLALGGEDGVESVVENFRADLDLTLGLCGCASVDELDRSCLIDTSEPD